MSAVRVEAPARLHLGMLAVANEGARRFGGLGVSIGHPAVMREAQPADELSTEGAEAERALTFAQRSRDVLGLPGGARLRIVETIPPHVGPGSGTSWRLRWHRRSRCAWARGRCWRWPGRRTRGAVGGWDVDVRARRSRGGGRSRKAAERPAPLLAQHPVPDEWRIVLVVPKAEPGLSGVAEARAFAQLAPSAEVRGDRAARADFVAAGARRARVEGVRQRADSRPAARRRRVRPCAGWPVPSAGGPLVQALLRGGAAGAGQSSWGQRSTASSAARWPAAISCARWRMVGGDGSVELVAFDNRGARVERS